MNVESLSDVDANFGHEVEVFHHDKGGYCVYAGSHWQFLAEKDKY